MWPICKGCCRSGLRLSLRSGQCGDMMLVAVLMGVRGLTCFRRLSTEVSLGRRPPGHVWDWARLTLPSSMSRHSHRRCCYQLSSVRLQTNCLTLRDPPKVGTSAVTYPSDLHLNKPTGFRDRTVIINLYGNDELFFTVSSVRGSQSSRRRFPAVPVWVDATSSALEGFACLRFSLYLLRLLCS